MSADALQFFSERSEIVFLPSRDRMRQHKGVRHTRGCCQSPAAVCRLDSSNQQYPAKRPDPAMHRLCQQEEIQLGAGNERQPGGNFIGGGASPRDGR